MLIQVLITQIDWDALLKNVAWLKPTRTIDARSYQTTELETLLCVLSELQNPNVSKAGDWTSKLELLQSYHVGFLTDEFTAETLTLLTFNIPFNRCVLAIGNILQWKLIYKETKSVALYNWFHASGIIEALND